MACANSVHQHLNDIDGVVSNNINFDEKKGASLLLPIIPNNLIIG